MVKSIQDSTSLTLNAYDPHNDCHRNCEDMHPWYDLISRARCKVRCDDIFKAPESHSQISEKLADIANNLHNEAEELTSIAGDLYQVPLVIKQMKKSSFCL